MERTWDKEVWSVIAGDFARLGTITPCKADEASEASAGPHALVGGIYMSPAKICEELNTKGEVRGVFQNLAWTCPTIVSIPDDVVSMANIEKAART